MLSHACCFVEVCNDDKRYLERIVKHGNIKGEVIMYKLPIDEDKTKSMDTTGVKGQKGFFCS